jgi:tetratricopeptide (TPR) repeat protein
MKNILVYICFGIIILSCKSEHDQDLAFVTTPADYAFFLEANPTKSYAAALKEKDFWSRRLGADSTGVGDLGPLAGAYSKLFETNGNIQYLKDAETVYKKAISVASIKIKDGYKRALAKNYISQHRFKEATILLETSYAGVSNKQATELMLFDCYMEIGSYDKAEGILKKIENLTDYNYLIRISKWSDYKGQLPAAIRYMEKAMNIAESRNSLSLKIWTYANIADYYGHNGNIKAAYTHYLKTLELHPDNAYAKKGIAWILYSKEHNISEANRILDILMATHRVPEDYLFKAQLARYQDKTIEADRYLKQFFTLVENPLYGPMYNTHKIKAWIISDPEKALALAEKEINNRATPETYHLLALAQLATNQKELALTTIENFVNGKISEPMALLHSALVYKANGQQEKVVDLKIALTTSAFELGPIVAAQIADL